MQISAQGMLTAQSIPCPFPTIRLDLFMPLTFWNISGGITLTLFLENGDEFYEWAELLLSECQTLELWPVSSLTPLLQKTASTPL